MLQYQVDKTEILERIVVAFSPHAKERTMHDIDWTWCPRVAAHEITRNFLLDGFLQRLAIVPQAIQLTREMLLFLYPSPF
jgi:hypothetical protein